MQTTPELRLLLVALQCVAITGVAVGAARVVRGRADLERLSLRAALVLTLIVSAVLASGWTWNETPRALTPVVVMTPAALQTALEETKFSMRLATVLLLWGVVAAALLTRLSMQLVRSRRLVQHSRPLTRTDLAHIPLSCDVREDVRESDDVQSPATVGNTILLPADWRTLAPDELSALLIHERGHVARGDFWWCLIARVQCACFWWDPLAWWTASRLALLGEQLSDDDVLQTGTPGVDYASLLLRYLRAPAPTATVVHFSATPRIHLRLDRILAEPSARRPLCVSRMRRLAWSSVVAVSMAAPALWAAGMLTESQRPLRYVFIRGAEEPVLMSGTQDDLQRALSAADGAHEPVLWYARGSRVSVVRDTCVTAAMREIHAANASPAALTNLQQRTKHLIRRIEHL